MTTTCRKLLDYLYDRINTDLDECLDLNEEVRNELIWFKGHIESMIYEPLKPEVNNG